MSVEQQADRADAWEPSVEAIDAIFDEDYDRAEDALLLALSETRKLKAQGGERCK